MVKIYCSVKTCLKKSTGDSNFKFFSFPVGNKSNSVERSKLLEEWLQFTGDPTLNKNRLSRRVICELHFEDSAFPNKLRQRLLRDAKPTLHGPNSKSKKNDDKDMSDNTALKQNQEEVENQHQPHSTGDKDNSQHSSNVVTKLQGVILGKDKTHTGTYFFVPDKKSAPLDDNHDPCDSVNDTRNNGSLLTKTRDPGKYTATEDSDLADDRHIPSALHDHTYELNRPPNEGDIIKSIEQEILAGSNTPSQPNIEVFTKDFHFCGKCQKVFDSFEKFVIHKLLDEQNNMTFEEAPELPGLWLPRLQEKMARNQDSDDSGSESDGWDVPNDPSMTCRHCGQYFNDKRALKFHRHSAQCVEYPYRCEYCSQPFKTKGPMLKHHFLHHHNSEL